MASYRYLAYDSTGRRTAQTVAASSAEQVKRMLWEQGLHIVDIKSAPLQDLTLDALFPTLFNVRRSEVILFTRQLATFVRVGMPILDGLTVLAEQASSAQMRGALSEMIRDLGSGSSLSEAMGKLPKIFSGLYVDMIRSAEVSGQLDEVLRQLAIYMSRDESALRKVRNAMIYPVIVISLALTVIGVLIAFVLPAFARLFSDFRATMPLPTRILLAVGTFCAQHIVMLLILLLLIVAALLLYSRTARGQETMDVLLLRAPVLGTIIRYAIVERYLRTLATLARAGVPVTQMLSTASQSVGSVTFRRGLEQVRDRMLSGDGFARPLRSTGLFPSIVIQMIKVGEETGSLDTNLLEAAEHYAEEVDYRLKQMIALLEPALVIVVGVMVGFIAISVIAPMYSLVHAVH